MNLQKALLEWASINHNCETDTEKLFTQFLLNRTTEKHVNPESFFVEMITTTARVDKESTCCPNNERIDDPFL
jgi:hypothetical protein